MSLRCPQCDRSVYDRRQRACGFCGAALPPEFGAPQPGKAARMAEALAAGSGRTARLSRTALALRGAIFLCALVNLSQALRDDRPAGIPWTLVLLALGLWVELLLRHRLTAGAGE